MFTVSLTNFGTHFPDRFETWSDAVAFAKSKGFEATIHDARGGGVRGTWSPINGPCDWSLEARR